jgi:hypothetical protein
MFKKNRGGDDGEPTLVEAWQALAARHGLAVDVTDEQSIRAGGTYRGRTLAVDIHRDRKPTEPFHGLASRRRRGHMRQHWVTEVTVSCTNPAGSVGALQTFTDIRDPSWDPRNFDPAHCRIVRTEPASLADRVFTSSIHERLAGMRYDHQIHVEPTRIRLFSNDTAAGENGYFIASPIHSEYPGSPPPWPERALVGPSWWFDLLCDIADAIDTP